MSKKRNIAKKGQIQAKKIKIAVEDKRFDAEEIQRQFCNSHFNSDFKC